MSPVTIRLRPAMSLADLTPVLAQDRTTAAVVDTHPTVAVDHRLTVAEAVLLRTVEVAEGTAIHTRVPVPIASGGKTLSLVDKEKSDGQPTVALSAFKDEADRFTRRLYRFR